jgi:N-acetylmuramoyl-L-alanine amidase
MIRKFSPVLSFVIFIAVLLSSAGTQTYAQQKPVLRTIIVDPGHGMGTGTKGLISREDDVALAISLKLGKRIEEEMPDVKVVYTRTTDEHAGGMRTLKEANRYRAKMANDLKADLFVSIHCNATVQKAGGWYAKRVIGHKNKTVYVGKGSKRRKKTIKVPITESYYVKNTRHGTETYIWAADRSSVKSEYINPEEAGEYSDSTGATAESDMPDMSSPEARIRAQLYEKKYFAKSLTLASFIEEEFAKGGRQSGGVQQRNWEQIWVLQATGMPSVLVETGFLSNQEEEEYLNSEKGQQEVVESIVTALKRYRDNLTKAPLPF